MPRPAAVWGNMVCRVASLPSDGNGSGDAILNLASQLHVHKHPGPNPRFVSPW
jgi:hypothetical protein